MKIGLLNEKLEPLQNAKVAITLSNLKADDTPLIFVNKAFETLTGYNADEAVGRNCRFLQGPKSNPKTVLSIRDAIEKQKGINVCLANYRADGSLFHNLLLLTPLIGLDDTKLILGCQYDISHRIQVAKIGEHIERLNGLIDYLKPQTKTAWQATLDSSHLISHSMTTLAENYLKDAALEESR